MCFVIIIQGRECHVQVRCERSVETVFFAHPSMISFHTMLSS